MDWILYTGKHTYLFTGIHYTGVRENTIYLFCNFRVKENSNL